MTLNRLALTACLVGAVLVATLYAQATNIHSGGTLPTSCRTGDLYVKTGSSAGLYSCISDVWTGPYSTSGGSLTTPGTTTDEAIVRWNGTGGSAIQDSGITISDGNVITFPDGVKQTFNPDGTNAGVNVGAQAGDPSALANGDIWYNSSANKFKCRENGVTADCISSSGSVGDLLDYVFILKPGDETVTASNTFQSDDDLNVSIGASETWIIEWTLAVDGNNATDFKVALNVPSGATGRSFSLCNNVSASTFSSDLQTASSTTLDDTAAYNCASPGAGNENVNYLKAVVVNSTNAGTVTLRWAGVNATNNVKVKAGSYVTAHRVN